jgi:hypothetical protein
MIINIDTRMKPVMFADKIFTKEWLNDNTTLAYPKNVVSLDDFDKAIVHLADLPNGEYVWKPCYGRKCWGIVLLTKKDGKFEVFPSKEPLSLQDTILELIRIKRLSISVAREAKLHRQWFAEEWIHPHERFYRFTDDKRCPPVIRICGRSKVHFVVLSPVYFESAGISAAGWGHRKYIWLDFDGVIRRADEMDLSHTDRKTPKSVVERGLETPFYGDKIDGIPEIIEQVNREISPKLKLVNNKCWSVDGIFDQDNKFVVIEINSAIGTPFLGVKWKK